MNTHNTIHQRIRHHDRDVTLLGRLFAEWNRGRTRRTVEADQRLDALEAQLARLEWTVTMEVPAATPARPTPNRPDSRRASVPLAAQTS